MKYFPIVLFVLFILSCSPTTSNYWVKVCEDEDLIKCGYQNEKGELKIDYGKYAYCFTDTFKNYAIVVGEKGGLIAIDKEEKTLFNVYMYDNGPDYPSEGVFRIEENGKIGFVNMDGEITIPPKYAAAAPFRYGYTAVCQDCKTVKEGEYSRWVGKTWGVINTVGKVVLPLEYDRILKIEKGGSVLVEKNGNKERIELE